MAENNNTNNKQQSVPDGTAVDTDKTAAKEATAAGEAAENANKKASATNRNINLRNERYRIWAQRKQGMLLGIL